jgi:hypothetical protein
MAVVNCIVKRLVEENLAVLEVQKRGVETEIKILIYVFYTYIIQVYIHVCTLRITHNIITTIAT